MYSLCSVQYLKCLFQGYEPTSVYSVIASVILAKLSMILALFLNFWLEIQNLQKSSFHDISDYFNTFKRPHSVENKKKSLFSNFLVKLVNRYIHEMFAKNN